MHLCTPQSIHMNMQANNLHAAKSAYLGGQINSPEQAQGSIGPDDDYDVPPKKNPLRTVAGSCG